LETPGLNVHFDWNVLHLILLSFDYHLLLSAHWTWKSPLPAHTHHLTSLLSPYLD
jgi:hypothetical protein